MTKFVMIDKTLVNTRYIVKVYKKEGMDTDYKGQTFYTRGNGHFFCTVETTSGEITLSSEDYDSLIAELKGEKNE